MLRKKYLPFFFKLLLWTTEQKTLILYYHQVGMYSHESQLCDNNSWWSVLFFPVTAGGDHAGLSPWQRGGDVQQLPGGRRTLGGHGVPGGRRAHRHRDAHQVTAEPVVVATQLFVFGFFSLTETAGLCQISWNFLDYKLKVEFNFWGLTFAHFWYTPKSDA